MGVEDDGEGDEVVGGGVTGLGRALLVVMDIKGRIFFAWVLGSLG
jgi:hypothetical protein